NQQLPGIIGLTSDRVQGQHIMLECNRHGIAISTGSACRVGETEPSRTMLAMGKTKDIANSVFRLSYGKKTTKEELNQTIQVLHGMNMELKTGVTDMAQERMLGHERRKYIVSKQHTTTKPVGRKTLAEETRMSRQVIVTDMALLKTSNEPIIATNRCYIYIDKKDNEYIHQKVIICQHTPEQARKEL